MGARGGPCPGGGTLLRAGWQEAGLPRGHSARPGVRLLTEAASKVLHIQDRKTQRLQAKPRVPPHTHTYTVHGAGALRVPVRASRGAKGPALCSQGADRQSWGRTWPWFGSTCSGASGGRQVRFSL